MESGMVAVDKWTDGSQAYFLTHLHADHTVGLSRTWKKGPLYCSRLTATLFPAKFPGFDLSLLRILDLGTWHSLSLVSPSSGSAATVQVMAIDAHHCPGAVMFLFHGDFGCMLYTGDFRWERKCKRADNGRKMLLNALKSTRLDILHLDNTYCNPAYAFPSREVAAMQILNIIKAHPEHDIIIGLDSLGKEELLLYISRALEIKIWVWPERLQIMHLLGFQDIFTTKTSLTRVRAVPRYSFSIETLEALNTIRPTIGIMPSGLPWLQNVAHRDSLFGASVFSHDTSKLSRVSTSSDATNSNEGLQNIQRYHRYAYSVPYSDHSCFVEIEEFIKDLQPRTVKGIVSSASLYIDPLYYFRRVCKKRDLKGLNNKHGHSEGCETAEAVKTPSLDERDNSCLVSSKRRIRQVKPLGIRLSRVSYSRRVRCGAKILDFDSPA